MIYPLIEYYAPTEVIALDCNIQKCVVKSPVCTFNPKNKNANKRIAKKEQKY
jgi:hypothetical protein